MSKDRTDLKIAVQKGQTSRPAVLPRPRRMKGEKAVKGRSQLSMVWRELCRNRMAMLGLGAVLFLTFVAVFAPELAPYDPYEISRDRRAPPCAEHPLGNDELGRDILSRLIYGSRIALGVSSGAVTLGILIGSVLGLVAGFYGGRVDMVIMGIVDLLLAFPGLLLAIAIMATLGPGLRNATLAIAFYGVPIYARLVRSSALSVKAQDYVLAAHSVGMSSTRIIFRHVLPNSLSPLIVLSTVLLARAVLSEASLSFLGLGAQPPEPSWGSMVSSGREYLTVAPHIATFPGLTIMFAVVAVNLLGDGLRDALDPRLRGRGA